MAFRETSDFDMPIPGMAMTHELGARPWQSPPKMITVEEGIDFYVSRIVDNKMAGRLLDIIETGVPLTAIAETLTLGGVMQGLHTIDVAVLVNPVLPSAPFFAVFFALHAIGAGCLPADVAQRHALLEMRRAHRATPHDIPLGPLWLRPCLKTRLRHPIPGIAAS